MKLFPAEPVEANPRIGGAILVFDSGLTKSVSWNWGAPIEPTLDAAKQYAASVIQALLDERCMAEVESTNWASATAALQAIIVAWNERLRAHLYAQVPHAAAH